MSNLPDHVDTAIVHFAPDKALVLFELLSRWTDRSGSGASPGFDCFESTAETAVLNDLLGQLERQPVTPFSADYAKLLDEARTRLASGCGYPTLRD